jgi:hypothetical protein
MEGNFNDLNLYYVCLCDNDENMPGGLSYEYAKDNFELLQNK